MPEPREDRVQELANALDGKDEPETPGADQPVNEATPDETGQAQEQDAPTDDDSFYELDLSAVPEDADREWLAKRHREMQAAFTKKTTSLAEQRREAEKIVAASNDPDAQRALLHAWGYDLQDDTPDDDYDDEGYDEEPTRDDFRSTKEWQEFQQLNAQLKQAAQQEQVEGQFREQVEALEAREGREVDDTEWELLWNLSQTGMTVDDGFDRISQLRKQERVAHSQSKKAPQVPTVGKSATQIPDLSDEQTRVDFLAEQIEANRQGN